MYAGSIKFKDKEERWRGNAEVYVAARLSRKSLEPQDVGEAERDPTITLDKPALR